MTDQLIVLIVEDDPDVLATLTLFVQSFPDVDILAAESFAQASEWIMTAQRIDLSLCDVVLPGLQSGIDVAKLAVERHPDVAVVIMSADLEGEIAGLSERFSFMQKPFGVDELTRIIDAAFLRLRTR